MQIRRKKILFVYLVLFVGMLACSSKQERKKSEVTKPIQLTSFPWPQVPAILTDPTERAVYAAKRFWDKFDFSDTTLIHRPEITEQGFAEFFGILSVVDKKIANEAIVKMLSKAAIQDSLMFTHFIELSERYLYDPNSPLRNEEFYITALQYIIGSDKVADLNKVRPQYQLDMAMKNRPNTKATDFVYTLRNGKTGRLSNVQAEYTILFFNNPDCPDCKRVLAYIKSSSLFTEMLKPKGKMTQLAILALYPDPSVELWREMEYPKEWINAYDPKQVINKEQLYDLKAIPTLYLLDKQKQVILKDAPIELIAQFFQQ